MSGRAVVCAGCGCLCDDIRIERRADGSTHFANACPVGERWLGEARPAGAEAFAVGGARLAVDEAVRRAAALLSSASAPLVTGLVESTIEAAREAVRIAEALRCPLIPWPPMPMGPRRAGLGAPEIARSLGEVRGRAKLVVFWRADPVETHPRHLERYSLDPRLCRTETDGIESHPSGRKMVLVGGPDVFRLSSARRAARTIPLAGAVPGRADIDLVRALRLRFEGKEYADDAEAAALGDLILDAKNVHFFLGDDAAGDPALWDQLSLLAVRAPDPLRLSLSAMGGPGNGRGAHEAVAWQTGFGGPVDFSSGAPQPLDATLGLPELLARGAADAVLSIGLPPETLPDPTRSALARIDRISIGNRPDPLAAVQFAAAGLGPRVRGRVMRSDGVVLWLSGVPEEGENDATAGVLAALAAAIEAGRRGREGTGTVHGPRRTDGR